MFVHLSPTYFITIIRHLVANWNVYLSSFVVNFLLSFCTFVSLSLSFYFIYSLSLTHYFYFSISVSLFLLFFLSLSTSISLYSSFSLFLTLTFSFYFDLSLFVLLSFSLSPSISLYSSFFISLSLSLCLFSFHLTVYFHSFIFFCHLYFVSLVACVFLSPSVCEPFASLLSFSYRQFSRR